MVRRVFSAALLIIGAQTVALAAAAMPQAHEHGGLFERQPAGFDLQTLDRLREWIVALTGYVADAISQQHIALNIASVTVTLLLIAAIIYAISVRHRFARKIEASLSPLATQLPPA